MPHTSPRLRLLLPLATTLLGAPLAHAAPPDSGDRLLLFAYGDTRPNFWPLGGQRKHHAIAEAMVALDEAEDAEADGVLVSGDYIFADVPLTDRDWKPAWEAMEVMTKAPHPLPVRPVQGNHELHAVKGLDADDPDAALAADILKWAAGVLPKSQTTDFDPAILASVTRLADSRLLAAAVRHELLPPDLTKELTASRLAELRDQLEPELAVRLDEDARERLADWSSNFNQTLDILQEKKTNPAALRTMHQHFDPTLQHLRALYKLARQGNKGAAPGWLAETRRARDGGIGKAWRLFRERLIQRFGPSMVAGTSLEGVDTGATSGPSWYRFDHPIPGSSQSLRVIGLNTNLSHVAGRGGPHDPLEFLVTSVREHDGPILLYGHHPVITAGHHGEDWEDAEEELISSTRRLIFVTLRARVTPAEHDRIWAFVAGHDHDYERFVDRDAGRVFMVAGGGGVPLRNRGVPESDVPRMLAKIGPQMGADFGDRSVWKKAYHFVAVEVGPGTMSLKVYGLVESPGEPFSDEELASRLTPAVLAQRTDPRQLVDHVILRQRPGALGRTVEAPATLR